MRRCRAFANTVIFEIQIAFPINQYFQVFETLKQGKWSIKIGNSCFFSDLKTFTTKSFGLEWNFSSGADFLDPQGLEFFFSILSESKDPNVFRSLFQINNNESDVVKNIFQNWLIASKVGTNVFSRWSKWCFDRKMVDQTCVDSLPSTIGSIERPERPPSDKRNGNCVFATVFTPHSNENAK